MARACAIAILLAACEKPSAPSQNSELHGPWSAPVEPFRVVGNIYYVGARNIASYLIATPAGHILIDTGTKEMVPVVERNIAKLGFRLADVKILLNSHAHYDHVQGHAAIQQASGARVMVMRGDADAIATGVDRSPLGDEGWTPVRVARVLDDGDVVTLGGTTLQAIAAPGHTPGCTVWATSVRDTGRDYAVVFYGCVRPNDGVKLIGNPKFPNLVDETKRTFRRMRTLAPDIYLTMHPEDLFADKLEHMNDRPHPLADRNAWPKLIDEAEADFDQRVQEQSSSVMGRRGGHRGSHR